ncbi:hypothetical protein ACFW9P_45470, partial [Streptomyces sp. NPDC059489]
MLAEGVAGAYRERDTDGGVLDAAVAALDGALAGIQNGPYHDYDQAAALNLRAALVYYVREGHVNAPQGMPSIRVGGEGVNLGPWLRDLRRGVADGRVWVIPVLSALGMRWGKWRPAAAGEVVGAAPAVGAMVVFGGGSGRVPGLDDVNLSGGVSADLAESLGVLAEGVAGAYQQRDTDGGVLDAAVAALDGALAGIQNGPYGGHDRGAALNLRAALAYYVREGHVNAPERTPPIGVGDREVKLGLWLRKRRRHGVAAGRVWVRRVLNALGMGWGRRQALAGEGVGAAPFAGQVVVSGGGGGEVVPGLGDGGLGEGLTAVVPESAGGLGADAGAGSLGEYVSAVSDVPMELSDVDGGFFDASMVLGGALEFPQGGDDLGEWLEGLDSDLRLPMQGAGSPTAGQSQPVEGEPTWSAPIDQTGLEAPLNDASAQQSAIFDPLVHSWEQGADHPGSWLDLLGAHLGDGGAEDSEVVGADWFHDLGNAQGDVPPEGDGLVQGSVAGRQGGVSADLAESLGVLAEGVAGAYRERDTDGGVLDAAVAALDGALAGIQNGPYHGRDRGAALNLRAALVYYVREGHVNAPERTPPIGVGDREVNLSVWLKTLRRGVVAAGRAWVIPVLDALGMRWGRLRPPAGEAGESGVADAGGGVSAGLAESLGVLAEGVAGAYQQRDGADGGVLDAAVAALDGALAGIQNGPYSPYDRGAALNLRAALAYYVREGHVNAPQAMPPLRVGDIEVKLGVWVRNVRRYGMAAGRAWVRRVLDVLGMRWGRLHLPAGEGVGAAPFAGEVVSGGGGGEVVPGLGDGGLGEGLTAVVPESAGGLGTGVGAGSLGEYVSAVSDVPMELPDVDGGFFDASMVLGGVLEFPQGGDELGEWLEGLDSDLRLPMQGAGSPTAGQSQPVEGEPTWSAPIDQTGLEAPLNDASAQQSAIFDPLVHSWEQGADHPGSWLDLLGAHLGDGGAEDSEVVGADWFHDLGNAQGDVPPEGDGLVQGSVAGRQGGLSADLAESLGVLAEQVAGAYQQRDTDGGVLDAAVAALDGALAGIQN